MRKMLYLTVFTSGLASLAVEMAASRLLGNYFGTSNLVWASIIGLILIYLTVGYFVGGRWADHSPKFETFFSILAWASISIAFVPIISRPILRLAANAFDNLIMGSLIGSFVVVMILFIIPVTLLGTASPFAIRLALHELKTNWHNCRSDLCNFYTWIIHRHIPDGDHFDSSRRHFPDIPDHQYIIIDHFFDRFWCDCKLEKNVAIFLDAACVDLISFVRNSRYR